MRRIVGSLLLATLLVQSSGASALAANDSGGSIFAAIGGGFTAMWSPLHDAWLNSFAYAALNGQMNRYDAMHAPAPVIPHVIKILKAPDASRDRDVRMVHRNGIPAVVPGWHRPEAIDPRKAPRDPMAMRRSTPLGGPTILKVTPRFQARGRFAPTTATPQTGRVKTMSSGTLAPLVQATLAPPTTGINHYWTYEEEPLPGIGKAMANVGNGNLVVQVDDLDIPERGIDLAFSRTYNSQSQHDSNGTDGSTPSVFGNGWTNTFDAHLAYNATDNIISVYDIDGARYDFCANGSGGWQSCTSAGANNYTALTSDGSCGYYWTKKTGTAYYFEAPNKPSTCGTQTPAGLSGRILAIQGRNVNNSLSFTYSWANGDDTNPENLTQIVVSHNDGQALTLTFALLNGTGPDELQSITRPDGSSISYEYDNSGDLIEVDRPGNNTTSPQTCSSTNADCIPETYTYSGTYELATANSPRYTVSARNNGGTAREGDSVNFGYDSSRRIASMSDYGVVNFSPNDGTNIVLQSSYPTGLQTWYTETFSGYGTGTTTVSDSDGHSRMWSVDSVWRVTEAQEYTGSQWLVSYQSWDSNDDLLTFTDERDNTTTLEYDADGNAIMEAQPSVTTSMGTFQPTAWYQYDSYNNLVYYCDPNWVHQNGGDYPNGSDPCTGSPSGVVHYVWATGSSPEIYGELTDTYTPLSYHHHLTYDSYGEPLSVVGDTIDQADGTQRTPTQGFSYDSYGDLKTYNPGNGAWTMTYDSLNRVLTRQDPDGVYSYTCYYADGSTHYAETSYQHSLDGNPSGCEASPPGVYATAYSYDSDGDVLTQTAVHGGTYVDNSSPTLPTTQAITYKFYDADDRLVDVKEPYDSTNDLYTKPWITRYLYDLSQNGSVGLNGDVNYAAHGNLYKTQELLPSGSSSLVTWTAVDGRGPPAQVANTVYQDVKGTAFDALDRATAQYSLSSFTGSGYKTKPLLLTQTLTYDSSSSTLGLLAQACNGTSQCKNFSYDARASMSSTTFSDSTPSRTYISDPDGRTISITSSTFGMESYAYDSDGNLTTSQDPSSGGVTSPALLTHHYYADGEEESLDVSSSALTQSGLFTDSYRTDGLLQTQAVDDSDVSGVLNPGTTTLSYTYTAAGRTTERSESGAAANSTPTTLSYYSNGMEESDSTPSATLSGFEYSAEAEDLGVSSNLSNSYIGGGTYAYDVRGELLTWPQQQPTYSDGEFRPTFNRYANGVAVAMNDARTCYNCQVWYLSTVTYTIDDRMSVQAYNTAPDVSPYYGEDTASWEYDGAGRMDGTGAGLVGEGRTFDAENHPITSSTTWGTTGSNDKLYYLYNDTSWGPNGHPILIGGIVDTDGTKPTQFDTLHWDGDQLLFTTNSSGELDDIKIGSEGDILPLDSGYKGLTFYSRLPNGAVIGCHNATGATFAGVADSYLKVFSVGEPLTTPLSPCSTSSPNITTASPKMPTSIVWWGSVDFTPGQSGNPAAIGRGGSIGMPRADGYTDYADTIQGVRTYDSNAGTWTAPDAYAGDVGDPASEKAYMWDDNNPIMYSDPSGYDIQEISRDVWGGSIVGDVMEAEAGFPQHTYIHNTTNGQNITFGDVHGQLRQVPSSTEPGGGPARSVHTVCTGTCGNTWHGMERSAHQVDKAHRPYGYVTSNSNSANAGVLKAHGVNPNAAVTRGLFVPGLNQPVNVSQPTTSNPPPVWRPLRCTIPNC